MKTPRRNTILISQPSGPTRQFGIRNLALIIALGLTASGTLPLQSAPAYDEEMLRKAASMSKAELEELLQVYTRKKDAPMVGKISQLLGKNPPQLPEATPEKSELIDQPESDEKSEPVAEEPESAPTPTPATPAEIVQATALTATGKPLEAVAIIDQFLEKTNSQNKLYQLELASALDEAEQTERAITAYENVINDTSTSAEDRTSANARLTDLRMTAKLAAIRQHLDDNQPAPAREKFDQLSPAEVAAPSAQMLHADILIQSGDFAGAESTLEKLANDKSLDDETRIDAKNSLVDAKISRLLKEGETASDSGNRKLALQISQELFTLAPQRMDIFHFRARSLLATGQGHKALDLLNTPPATCTDPQASQDQHQLLAKAYETTGSLEKAVASYRQLASDSKLSAVERSDLLSTAEYLASFASPRVSSQWNYTDADEGTWSNLHFSAQTGHIGPGIQILAQSDWDSLSLAHGKWSDSSKEDLVEGTLSARLAMPSQTFIQGWVTGHDDGVGAGAAIGRHPIAGPGLQLRYDYQGRSTDSFYLRSINGRQNRISGSAELDLGHGFYVSSQAFWRQVTVDQHSLGDGAGIDLAFTKSLLYATADHPGVNISYQGEFSKFSATRSNSIFEHIGRSDTDDHSILNELVDPKINRHEAQLSIHQVWTSQFETTLTGAAGYEFEDEQTVWRVGLQAGYRLSDNARISLNADYDSSGQGANTGSSITTVSLGLAIDF